MSVIKLILLFVFGCIFIIKFPAIVSWFIKFGQFVKWKCVDISRLKQYRDVFGYYGMKMFVGRQGSGKTIGMVHYLELIRKKYPKAIICTNFDYKHQHRALNSLNDMLQIRNDEYGVVFAWDEIQNEFSCQASKDFPESLLSTITQQRKQKICILASSQVFMRVAKPLREQCYEVIECKTFFKRWTRLKCFDGDDYNCIVDNPDPKVKYKTPKKWKMSFVQSDDIRKLYDTWSVVERLSRVGFKEKLS